MPDRQSGFARRRQPFNRFRCDPDKHATVARRLFVHPFDDQFEVRYLLLCPQNADRLPRAMQHAVLPTPGVLGAVDFGEIRCGQRSPAGLRVVDHGTSRAELPSAGLLATETTDRPA